MRNVYLDPFGTYTNAYDKGMARQMDVESNRRQARAVDFDYNYMTPLRYDNARIDNKYYDRNARADTFNKEYRIGQQIGADTGMVMPAMSAIAGYDPRYDYQYNPETGIADWMRDGQPAGRTSDVGLIDRYRRPEDMQDREFMYRQQQDIHAFNLKIKELENSGRYQEAILLQQLLGGGGSSYGGGGYYMQPSGNPYNLPQNIEEGAPPMQQPTQLGGGW